MNQFIWQFLSHFIIFIIAVSQAGYSLEAEILEGFPQGPVQQVIETFNSGIDTDQNKWHFNQAGQLIEAAFHINNYNLRGILQWSSSGDVIEATFYMHGELNYRETYKYDSSPVIQDRLILWFEIDYGQLFCRYRHSGNLIEKCKFDNKGKFLQKLEYKYTLEGKESESAVYDQDLIIQNHLLTHYKDKDHILDRTLYDGKDAIRFQDRYEYDEKNNLLESVTQDPNSITRMSYTYDGTGKLSKLSIYRNNMLNYTTLYTYSENSKKIITTSIDKNDVVTDKTEETYDSRDNIIERIYSNIAENIFQRTTFTFDEFNRKTKTMQYKGEELQSSYEILYGSTGRIKEEILIPNNDSSNKTTYTYDKFGNLMQKNLSIGSSRELITTWNYSYYNDSITIFPSYQ